MESSNEVMATEEVPLVISREEIRHEQAMDDECDALRMSKVKDGIVDVEEDGILVRIAPLDGSRQIVVPWSLRPRLLWLEHFPVVAAQPGVSKCIRLCAEDSIGETCTRKSKKPSDTVQCARRTE
jgi:hypothetical protein